MISPNSGMKFPKKIFELPPPYHLIIHAWKCPACHVSFGVVVLVGEEPASGEFFPPYQPPVSYSSENLRILKAMMTNSNLGVSNISR